MTASRSVRRTFASVAVVVAIAVAGCTPSAVQGRPPGDVKATSRSVPPGTTVAPPTPGGAAGPSACPAGGAGGPGAKVVVDRRRADPVVAPTLRAGQKRAAPWKDRPIVRLCFDVLADRRVVRGTESVVFTPDRRTCEVDFRAWPNKPETAATGNRLDVTAVAVRGRLATPKVEAGGAPIGTPGTLVKVPVKGCLAPGRPVTIQLAFTLRLGADSSERVGFSTKDRTAWFATAYPLLAWERGHGWITDRAVDLLGETVTSEEFRLDELDVVAPKGDEVLGTGQARGTMPSSRSGSVVHRFSADAVRDVAVTVGQLQVAERTVGGVRIHVGVPAAGSKRPAGEWLDATEAAISKLSAHLGAFPYHDLWVTVEPDIPSGIELPGAIQFADINPRTYPQLVPHEVAHMWFYGLVGNNQARDPWLDEAFAEYAEVLVNGTAGAELAFRVPPTVRNRVGESMAWYDGLHQPGLYGAGVYRQGSAMLHKARQAVGPATFDRLLRGYINTNAHQIADDRDVGRAFASAPKVIAILRAYGALPK